MSVKKIIFAMFALGSLCSAHMGGQLSGQLATQDLNPRFYCGRALARMIATICYDDPAIEKRGEAGTMFGALIPPFYKEQENRVSWPWMAPSKARALGSRRGKRMISGGVADECCDKPCSISELLYYC